MWSNFPRATKARRANGFTILPLIISLRWNVRTTIRTIEMSLEQTDTHTRKVNKTQSGDNFTKFIFGNDFFCRLNNQYYNKTLTIHKTDANTKYSVKLNW